MNNHPQSLGVTCGHYVESLAIIVFQRDIAATDRATRILHDAGIAKLPYTSCKITRKELTRWKLEIVGRMVEQDTAFNYLGIWLKKLTPKLKKQHEWMAV